MRIENNHVETAGNEETHFLSICSTVKSGYIDTIGTGRKRRYNRSVVISEVHILRGFTVYKVKMIKGYVTLTMSPQRLIEIIGFLVNL